MRHNIARWGSPSQNSHALYPRQPQITSSCAYGLGALALVFHDLRQAVRVRWLLLSRGILAAVSESYNCAGNHLESKNPRITSTATHSVYLQQQVNRRLVVHRHAGLLSYTSKYVPSGHQSTTSEKHSAILNASFRFCRMMGNLHLGIF